MACEAAPSLLTSTLLLSDTTSALEQGEAVDLEELLRQREAELLAQMQARKRRSVGRALASHGMDESSMGEVGSGRAGGDARVPPQPPATRGHVGNVGDSKAPRFAPQPLLPEAELHHPPSAAPTLAAQARQGLQPEPAQRRAQVASSGIGGGGGSSSSEADLEHVFKAREEYLLAQLRQRRRERQAARYGDPYLLSQRSLPAEHAAGPVLEHTGGGSRRPASDLPRRDDEVGQNMSATRRQRQGDEGGDEGRGEGADSSSAMPFKVLLFGQEMGLGPPGQVWEVMYACALTSAAPCLPLPVIPLLTRQHGAVRHALQRRAPSRPLCRARSRVAVRGAG